MTKPSKSLKNCECPEGRDEMYHCKNCDECCFNWGLFKDKFSTYEDKGICGQCALNDGMSLEEMVTLID